MPEWVVGYHEADSLNEVEKELTEVLSLPPSSLPSLFPLPSLLLPSFSPSLLPSSPPPLLSLCKCCRYVSIHKHP
jgi:hypothetical protein